MVRCRHVAGHTTWRSRDRAPLQHRPSDAPDLLELTQSYSQGMGVVTNPVLVQIRAELLVALELLTATFDGRTDVRRQCVNIVKRTVLLRHDMQRVSGVPLYEQDLTYIPQHRLLRTPTQPATPRQETACIR